MARVNSPIAQPSRDDPDVAAASRWIGGPIGAFAAAVSRRRALTIMLAVTASVLVLGLVADLPCRSMAWAAREDGTVWSALCYSDVPFLYRERGFADGALPYRDAVLEYPVLTGAIMQVSAVVARALQGAFPIDGLDQALAESVHFYDVTTVLMALCAFVVVLATAATVPRRPWDAMLVAASPLLLLSATINWDLLAIALTSLAILAWTRDRPLAAGILVGLGAAAKLYPVLLLGPMLLVALRERDRPAALQRFGLTALGAMAAWLVVNVPVARWAPEGWRSFFSFNAERGADFGSIWYAIELVEPSWLPDDIDTHVVVAAAVLLALIVVLALRAPQPPRLAQLAFLAVAAFVVVNKVWSPQYTLWLLPLAALARPRWRDLAIWQVAEVMYFVAVWWYLGTIFGTDSPGVSASVYAAAIAMRIAALVWLSGRIAGDILLPEGDPVRSYVSREAPALATRMGAR